MGLINTNKQWYMLFGAVVIIGLGVYFYFPDSDQNETSPGSNTNKNINKQEEGNNVGDNGEAETKRPMPESASKKRPGTVQSKSNAGKQNNTQAINPQTISAINTIATDPSLSNSRKIKKIENEVENWRQLLHQNVASDTVSKIYYQQARSHQSKGQLEPAITAIEKSINIQPNKEKYTLAAELHKEAGNYSKASRMYQIVLSLSNVNETNDTDNKQAQSNNKNTPPSNPAQKKAKAAQNKQGGNGDITSKAPQPPTDPPPGAEGNTPGSSTTSSESPSNQSAPSPDSPSTSANMPEAPTEKAGEQQSNTRTNNESTGTTDEQSGPQYINETERQHAEQIDYYYSFSYNTTFGELDSYFTSSASSIITSTTVEQPVSPDQFLQSQSNKVLDSIKKQYSIENNKTLVTNMIKEMIIRYNLLNNPGTSFLQDRLEPGRYYIISSERWVADELAQALNRWAKNNPDYTFFFKEQN